MPEAFEAKGNPLLRTTTSTTNVRYLDTLSAKGEQRAAESSADLDTLSAEGEQRAVET